MEYIQIMETLYRHMKRRLSRLLAPPPPIHDLLDHPDLRRMSPHQLDDLPLPRCCRDDSVRR